MHTNSYRLLISIVVALLFSVSSGLMGCGEDGKCAAGTVEEGGFCRPIHVSAGDDRIRCGAGTVLDNGACVPDNASLSCGAGTVEEEGRCVLADDEASERDGDEMDADSDGGSADVIVDIQREEAFDDASEPADSGPTELDGSVQSEVVPAEDSQESGADITADIQLDEGVADVIDQTDVGSLPLSDVSSEDTEDALAVAEPKEDVLVAGDIDQ